MSCESTCVRRGSLQIILKIMQYFSWNRRSLVKKYFKIFNLIFKVSRLFHHQFRLEIYRNYLVTATSFAMLKA